MRYRASRLRIRQKLLLASLCFAAPIGVLLALLIQSQGQIARVAQSERLGIRFLRSLQEIAHDTARLHESLRQQDGSEPSLDWLIGRMAHIDHCLVDLHRLELDQQQLFLQQGQAISEGLLRLGQRWNDWKRHAVEPMNAAQELRQQSLETQIHEVQSLVGDASGLVIDPDLCSYYLAHAIVAQIPRAQNLADGFLHIAFQDPHSSMNRDQVLRQLARFEESLAELNSPLLGLRRSFIHDQSPSHFVSRGVEPSLERFLSSSGALSTAVQSHWIDPIQPLPLNNRIEDLAHHALDASRTLWSESADCLEQLLDRRIARLHNLQRQSIVLVGATLLMALLLVFRIMQQADLEAAQLEQLTQRNQIHEARTRAMIEAALDGIITIDDAGRIVEFNHAAETMFGRPRQEVIGRELAETIIPAELRELHRAGMQRYLETGESRVLGTRIEVPALRADGERIPIELAILPIHHGEGLIFTAYVRDLTSRKQSEAVLREAQVRAEAANRAKSEFLANMSHEIRTPLTAILGFTDLVVDATRHHTAAQEALATVKRNGEHLLEIINDILDLSKIEAGKFDLQRIALSPWQVLGDVVSLMQVRAEAKQLELSLAAQGPLPETIQSDPTRLRQILINLIGNAIKFTEQGSVRVLVRLNQDAASPQLQIDVCDTGIGMAEDQLARLFRPFSQVDSSMTRKFGGTGLGLAISRRMAEMLGGTLTVQSLPQQGSTFTLTIETGSLEQIPFRDSTSAPQPVRTQEPAPVAKLNCRVLLAEDGPDNQRLIAHVLSRVGADVTIVENGQRACDAVWAAQASLTPFDVVLMDMQMPILDGYAATERLRAGGYLRPIIALTAHAMSGDREKCLAAGCDDYTTKPINRQQLLELVSRYAALHANSRAADDPSAVVQSKDSP